MDKALVEYSLVLITGTAGVGKTALMRALLERRANQTSSATYVMCEEGDYPWSVVARVERSLDILPGSIADVLQREPRLVVIDELHRLDAAAAAELVERLLPRGSNPAGRILALSRDSLALPRGAVETFELNLEGLKEEDARAFWEKTEAIHGPTPQGTMDEAMVRSRCVPLGMRREYARALLGREAWTLSAMPDDERFVLWAAAILRRPAPPEFLETLSRVVAPDLVVSKVISGLIRRQLLDTLDDGRLEIHDVVRGAALRSMDAATRLALESEAAHLFDDSDPDHLGLADLDGASVDVVDPVDRVLEAVYHWSQANEPARAIRCLETSREQFARRGASYEALSLVMQLQTDDASAPALRAYLLAHLGQNEDALAAYAELEAMRSLTAQELSQMCQVLISTGRLEEAATRLQPLMDHIDGDLRARVRALSARVHLERGGLERARECLNGVKEIGRRPLSDEAKAMYRIVAMALEQLDPSLAEGDSLTQISARTIVDAEPGYVARMAMNVGESYAREGRLEEAMAQLELAEKGARAQEDLNLSSALRCQLAALTALSGRYSEADDMLHAVSQDCRKRGDLLQALRAELERAKVLMNRGRYLEAESISSAVKTLAGERQFGGLSLLASLIHADCALSLFRLVEAENEARELSQRNHIPAWIRTHAESILARASAWQSEKQMNSRAARRVRRTRVPEKTPAAYSTLIMAELAVAQGDFAIAFDRYEEAALLAESAGRKGELARIMAELARLGLARGDRKVAESTSSRALAQGSEAGADECVARALLVQAAMSRDDGDMVAAWNGIIDALTVARTAECSVEIFAAASAGERMARERGEAPLCERLGAIRRATSATMTVHAAKQAEQLLMDLGLTSVRPYRLVNTDGGVTHVSDVNAAVLQMDRRALVVDGVREQIVRNGQVVAELRRRTMLKKLLFMFSAAPGRSFTKEEIVERVWAVSYHPLRHDAALFTNIMRLRRLIGEGGEQILRAGDSGYSLAPPEDFLYVEQINAD